MKIPALLAACTLFVTALATAAEAPDSYAVVSLFGDDLTVVTYRSTTGTSLDRNDQQHVALSDSRYDRLATQVSTQAIQTALAGAKVATPRTR